MRASALGAPGETIDVACVVDVEFTAEAIFAHASLDGVEVQPGDVVLIHALPERVCGGERLRISTRATVRRAGALARAWMRWRSYFSLTDLCEVSFAPTRTVPRTLR